MKNLLSGKINEGNSEKGRDRGRAGQQRVGIENEKRSLSPYSPRGVSGEELEAYDSVVSGSLEFSQSKSRSRSVTPSKKVENEVEEDYSMIEDYEDDHESEDEDEVEEEESAKQDFKIRDRKSTRLNSSHALTSRMPSSA